MLVDELEVDGIGDDFVNRRCEDAQSSEAGDVRVRRPERYY
jgi:hypothetical protein